MTKDYLKRIIINNKDILRKHKIKSISPFGSYVRNEQRKEKHSYIEWRELTGLKNKLLEERRIKMIQARHRRREINLKIKQHSPALIEPENNQNHNLFQRTKIQLLT